MSSKNLQTDLGYSGKIVVKLVKDNIILQEKHYHNKCFKRLFRFFGECLAGNFSRADKCKPLRLKLFYNSLTPAEARKELAKIDSGVSPDGCTPISSFIIIDSLPVISSENNYSTTFHFLIPYAYLNLQQLGDNKTINQAMLYSAVDSSETSGSNDNIFALAYYLFTKEDSGEEIWDGINLSMIDDDVNIIIEWTMSIENIN